MATVSEKKRLSAYLRRLATMVVPGTPVWYYPIIGQDDRHAAVVAEAARELGDDQWVVRLKDLDEAYVAKHPAKRSTIPAVSLAAVEFRAGNAQAEDWTAFVSELADRFHDIASIITARNMLVGSDNGRRLTQPLREEFEKRAAGNELEIALRAFEQCVLKLVSVGHPDASARSCTAKDMEP